jgi:hypothetical protein
VPAASAAPPQAVAESDMPENAEKIEVKVRPSARDAVPVTINQAQPCVCCRLCR